MWALEAILPGWLRNIFPPAPAAPASGGSGVPPAQASMTAPQQQQSQQQQPAPQAPAEASGSARLPSGTAGKFNAMAAAGENPMKLGGGAELYVPKGFHPNKDGTYNVIYHFHGVGDLQRKNVEKANVNAVVVSVNLNGFSDKYRDGFKDPKAFQSLMERTQQAMEQPGRAPGAKMGHMALSSWSAGFAAIGEILKQPGMADRIDAVFLSDGLHTAYTGNHQVDDAGMKKWADFAERAKRGEKVFAVTHSSIVPPGYASTTETADELLRLTGVKKQTVTKTTAGGMKETYEADSGNFHVRGFEGTQKEDHVDQIKGMGDQLFPYLTDVWGKARPEPQSPEPRGLKPPSMAQ